jgi:choline-sulfatase
MFQRLLAIVIFLGSSFSLAANKPNIILISLDSARSNDMGFLGSKQGITPNLDSLARQSMVFEQAYAQAPTIVVSHATILTGTYPQTHHTNEFAAPLAASLPYLPDLLRARGYRTAAFVQSSGLDPRKGLAPGFDRGFQSYTGITRRADIVALIEKWFDGNTHNPGLVWLELSLGASNTASYNAALSFADAAVGKLFTALHKQKLFDDALIVVVSSRGASLGSHGEQYSNVFLYDETIHVPLLVKLPRNQDAGKRVKAKVVLVNVAPTILEIAGIPIPSQMQGQSLMRMARGIAAEQPVYSRSDFPAQAYGLSPLESWRAGKFLYIRAPKPELYDVSSDTPAAHNVAQTSKATLDTMASQLAAFNQHFNVAAGQPTQLTSSEMQKLASLGYVGVQKPAALGNLAVSGTDPKDAIAAINRIAAAAAALEEGKPGSAQASLEKFMSNFTNMYLAQYAMGVALAQQQKYSLAIPYLHRAIELQSDSGQAHYQMGSVLLKTNDYKTAAVHLEIAAERLPNFALAHALLSQAYDHLGRSEDSRREKAKAAQ